MHLVQAAPDHTIEGGQADPQFAGPCPGAPAHSVSGGAWCGRAAGGGDAFVATAVHQRNDQVVEHDPVRGAAAVANQDGHDRDRDGARGFVLTGA